MRSTARVLLVSTLALSVAGLVAVSSGYIGQSDAPSFEVQMCELPQQWLELTRRGYMEERAGQIALLPRTPMYMTTGGDGWTHSGPWDYLQRVPLVLYGRGHIEGGVESQRAVTLADVAPTIADTLGIDLASDGAPLSEALKGNRTPPRLIVTVVWDGGGVNALERWPDSWPNLARLMRDGAVFNEAIVGSSPSVTPAIHTTLGTGRFPATHGITGVPVRDEQGVVGDSFVDGKSSRFIEVPTVAEVWDEAQGGKPLVGVVGYEPWHLGMIGKGAETPGADKDHAVWINRSTNHWTTFEDHYSRPSTFKNQSDLAARLKQLDAEDGATDERWMRVPLDQRARTEETPAFIAHHGEKLRRIIEAENYGGDEMTDLLFTNFKQIDRVAHYYNMAAPEVREVMEETDAELGKLVDFLDRKVGEDRYVLVVTADHGMQPDVEVLDSFEIDPNELELDLATEFGPVVRAVWPTEVFLLEEEMDRFGVTVEDIATFLGNYRVRDNSQSIDKELFGSGRFSAGDRVFELAIPAVMLRSDTC